MYFFQSLTFFVEKCHFLMTREALDSYPEKNILPLSFWSQFFYFIFFFLVSTKSSFGFQHCAAIYDLLRNTPRFSNQLEKYSEKNKKNHYFTKLFIILNIESWVHLIFKWLSYPCHPLVNFHTVPALKNSMNNQHAEYFNMKRNPQLSLNLPYIFEVNHPVQSSAFE